MSDRGHDEDGTVVTDRPPVEERKDLALPPKYAVVLLNDDYTPMEFVVALLEQLFQKSPEDAEAIMMEIHTKGKGIAGIYPKDIAETRREQVISISRQNDHPFIAEVEALH